MVAGRGPDGAVVGAGVGGGDPGQGEVLGGAGAQPHLVPVPGVAQHVLVPSRHRAGEGGTVPFPHVRGRPDPDPGGCTGGEGKVAIPHFPEWERSGSCRAGKVGMATTTPQVTPFLWRSSGFVWDAPSLEVSKAGLEPHPSGAVSLCHLPGTPAALWEHLHSHKHGFSPFSFLIHPVHPIPEALHPPSLPPSTIPVLPHSFISSP